VRAEEVAAARAVEAAGLVGVAAGLVGELPLSLLSLFVLGFRVAASLLDHHKKAQHPHLPPDKGPTPPLTTRQGPFMILLFHSYTIVNLIVKELYFLFLNSNF
jgi:hypothetical protein